MPSYIAAPNARPIFLKTLGTISRNSSRVVEAVANGQAVLHKTIIQSLLDIYHRLNDAQVSQLADPEEKVSRLMLEGYDETEIAQARQSQPEQVETLIAELFSKLGIVQEEGVRSFPQVVHAMVNICVA